MKKPRYDDDYDRQEEEYYSSAYERKLAAEPRGNDLTSGRGLVSLGEALFGAVKGMGIAYELGKVCESPIEVIFGSHLKRLTLPDGFELVPQFKWRRWRMDFAILKSGDPAFFVECDGRQFHSTSDQIANDRAKDEAAKTAGITMIRFTGAEIHRWPVECAELVLQRVSQ